MIERKKKIERKFLVLLDHDEINKEKKRTFKDSLCFCECKLTIFIQFDIFIDFFDLFFLFN